jgi:hypothetical protein
MDPWDGADLQTKRLLRTSEIWLHNLCRDRSFLLSAKAHMTENPFSPL